MLTSIKVPYRRIDSGEASPVSGASSPALSPIEHKVDLVARTGFNHNFFAGLIYVTNGITGIASQIPSAAIGMMRIILAIQEEIGDATDVAIESAEEITEVPEAIGLRRFLSVLTGISNMIESVHMLHESKTENYIWGQIDAAIKMLRGISEASSGFIAGTLKAIEIWANFEINEASAQMASIASDILSCAQMAFISISATYSAYKAGSLKRRITSVDPQSSIISKIKSLRQNKLTRAPQMTSFEIRQKQIVVLFCLLTDKTQRQDKLQFKKILGEELYNRLKTYLTHFDKEGLQNEDVLLNNEVIDDVIKKLQNHEISYGILSAICLACGALSVASDFLTAGLVSSVIQILKPVLSLAVYHYDIVQFKQGLEDDKKESRLAVFMRYALALVCISIAVATFLTTSAASGGAVPLTLLIIGITMPLISLYISRHKEKIKSGIEKIKGACQKVFGGFNAGNQQESKIVKFHASYASYVNPKIPKAVASLNHLKAEKAS